MINWQIDHLNTDPGTFFSTVQVSDCWNDAAEGSLGLIKLLVAEVYNAS